MGGKDEATVAPIGIERGSDLEIWGPSPWIGRVQWKLIRPIEERADGGNRGRWGFLFGIRTDGANDKECRNWSNEWTRRIAIFVE